MPRLATTGVDDLRTKFPELALEAYGWDPSTILPGSNEKRDWKCNQGHIYSAMVVRRSMGTGCPVCAGRQVLAGFNDLQTRYPEIAAEAYGWDPTTVMPGSSQKRDWKCTEGHIFSASANNRTNKNNKCGCPVCAGQQVLTGFNDLKTRFPDIAAEAYGWDPSQVMPGTAKKRNWKCNMGHIYETSSATRTVKGSGCPICAEYGFNPEKDAWFYLMQRPGEQQLGITNELDVRRKAHERNGWVLLEHTEPAPGQKVLDTEKVFKQWLKKEIGLVKGTTENWSTTSMEVQSLAELKARSGIKTDLF